MTTHTSCPYCNTSFAPDAVLPGGRIECPRCGETFTTKGHIDPAELNGEAPPYERKALIPQRDERRITGLLVIAFALLAVTAISFLAYKLYKARRPDPEPVPPGAMATRPLDLPGLVYLPRDCNLVFGFQPGPVLEYATRTNQDARQLLLQAGLPIGVFAFLDHAGIPLDQVDHIVGGSVIGDTQQELRFALTLVLRTAPNDEEKFLRVLDAKRSPTGNGRYNVNMNFGFKLPLSLVKVSPTTWVFGWSDVDLAPAEKGTGGGLSPGLREMLDSDFLDGSAIWLAAGDGKWADKPLMKQVAELSANKDLLPALAKGRSALVGLTFTDEPRLRILARCVDDATAAKLRDAITAKEIRNSETGGSGTSVQFNVRVDPKNSLQSLKQLLDAVK